MGDAIGCLRQDHQLIEGMCHKHAWIKVSIGVNELRMLLFWFGLQLAEGPWLIE